MSWSRKKSCAHCRSSKARCNKAFPACSRCSERELPCRYEGRIPDRAAPYSLHSPRASSRYAGSPPTQSWPVLPTGIGGVTSDTEFDNLFAGAHLENPLADLTPDLDLDWWLPEAQTTASKVFEIPLAGDYRQGHPTYPPQSDKSDETSSSSLRAEPVHQRQRLRLTTNSVQQVPAHRTLMRRATHSTCPLTMMVLGQILSYPRMLVEGDQPPPFVHPRCFVDEELAYDCAEAGKHLCLPKQLAVCASLVGIFYDRTQTNRSFVWDMTSREVDSIREGFEDMNQADQLSALQSLVVLLLLQAEAPETAVDNGVSSLIDLITTALSRMIRASSWDQDMPFDVPDRREWIWRESVRRIVLLLGVIDLLLEGLLSTSQSFRHEFGDVPLPAHRRLWGARTNKSWRVAYNEHCACRAINKTLRVNDLIEADQAGCFSNQRTSTRSAEVFSDLARWCEGSDMLSMLVWMVMPFEQHRRRTGQ